MNLNPNSPFSGKYLSDCDNHELDAWAAKLCGLSVHVRLDSYYYTRSANGLAINNKPSRTEWHVPPFTTTWADAGPLMERAEFNEQEVCIWHDREGWHIGVNQSNMSGWQVVQDSLLLAVCNAFIIAAEHAKEHVNESQ